MSLYICCAIVAIYLFVHIRSWLLGPGGLSLRELELGNQILDDDLTLTPQHVAISSHPIEKLWASKHAQLRRMVANQSKTVGDAVTEYTRRYGRFPPQGFEAWVELALARNMLLIDEFDSMTASLQRFSRLPPRVIKQRVNEALTMTEGDLLEFTVRNHKLEINFDKSKTLIGEHLWSWMSKDKDYLRLLPDMRFLVNNLDEPKVAAPLSTLQPEYLAPSEKKDPLIEQDGMTEQYFLDLGQRSPWQDMIVSCPQIISPPTTVFGQEPQFVSDIDTSRDLCSQPTLSGLHGLLMKPETLTLTHNFVPIWSQAKLSTFQDILFPSPWYSAHATEYDPNQDLDWRDKETNLYWSGSTTGGHADVNNWPQFQRQRAVLGTMPGYNERVVHLLEPTDTNSWVSTLGNSTDFQHLFHTKITAVIQCDENACDQQRNAFHLSDEVTVRDRLSDSYSHKYLLDLDGNGFSGRFYRLLHSKSAVIKQTIFQEWHDDWLVPWVHYIPLSIQGDEIWEIMRWLETERGDEIGRSIAEEGAKWARRVLRQGDMELVFLRLLLEYGRLVDEV